MRHHDERTRANKVERPSKIQSANLAPFFMLRFPFLSALFIIRAATIGAENQNKQHASGSKMNDEISNTPRKIGKNGDMRPTKNPLSTFHFCCLSMVPGNNITLSGAPSPLPVPPGEASSLCPRQYPEVLNSNALQPSNAHFLSPMYQTGKGDE